MYKWVALNLKLESKKRERERERERESPRCKRKSMEIQLIVLRVIGPLVERTASSHSCRVS